jgi:phosphatidylglycerophosphatase A
MQMKRFFVTIFGSFFYTGFFPFAPASFASLIWLLVWLFVPGGHWMTHWAIIVGLIPVAIVISGTMEKYYGEDASCIVIDEVVGMQITLLLSPVTLKAGLVGYVLFRIFDIVKPFPAGRAERLPGGVGVVVDDIVAGLYALAVMVLLRQFTGLL